MEERRLSATAWHYLRGRFILDFLTVLGDWIGLFAAVPASGGETTARNVRILGLTKLLRCVRIFRALRLVRVASTFFDHVAVRVGSSWGVILLLFRVGLIFLALLWFNHLLACGCAGVGLYGPTDTGSHWMDTVHGVLPALDFRVLGHGAGVRARSHSRQHVGTSGKCLVAIG